MIHKLTLIAACAVMGAGSLAAPSPASAQSAPSSALTERFANFLSDALAGRAPSHIAPNLQSQTSQLFSMVKQTLGGLGAFRRLEYVREDTMQGYSRYHYRAVFDKGTRGLIFIVNSSGTLYGFGEDPTATSSP